MIYRNYKESKSIKLNYRYFCVYCGNECKNDEEWDDRDMIDHYYCDCQDACKEMELNKQILQIQNAREQEIKNVSKPYNIKICNLKHEMPTEKYSVQTKVMKIEV